MITVLIIIVHVLVSTLMIGVILLQSGKGAEIGAAFGGSSQTAFGSPGPRPPLPPAARAPPLPVPPTTPPPLPPQPIPAPQATRPRLLRRHPTRRLRRPNRQNNKERIADSL